MIITTSIKNSIESTRTGEVTNMGMMDKLLGKSQEEANEMEVKLKIGIILEAPGKAE